MNTPTPMTLRHRLRAGTRQAHQMLDDLLSQLDLQSREGLSCFLAMQVGGLSKLTDFAPHPECRNLIDTLLASAIADLKVLSATRAPIPDHPIAHPHPLSISYVVTGSRLGNEVLKRRWQGASDPAVKQASAYFALPGHIEHWRAFCRDADAIAPDSALADHIIAGANDLFALYHSSAIAALTENEMLHA